MKIRTSWRRTAALVAAGALVLTACSGDEEPEEPVAEEESEDTGTDDEDMDDEDMDEEDAGGEVLTAEGVTAEPCPEEAPETVNADNGCIYLGVISDLTQGPFAAAGPAIVDAQIAFWTRVNEEGGIGGAYDVNISENVRDNLYNPETHNQVYQEIKPNILALAQSLGSPTTQAILEDLKSSNIVAAPASWTSANDFESVILESGNNYCVEASNGLDFYVEQNGEIESVLAVHLPGDYGWDGAAGAKKWADANGATFANVQVTDSTDAAVAEIGNTNPDVVVITLGPTQTAEVVGGAAGRGYQGFFIGNSPTWNPALLASAAGPAFQALYWQAAPWGPYDSDTAGHAAMREQIESMADELESYNPDALSDFFTAGWAWSYPLEAALQAAYESGDLTRAGVANAATALDAVDYEGFLPAEAGDFTGDAANQSFGGTWVAAPDAEAVTGVSTAVEDYRGATAAAFPFDQPCYVEEGFAG
jgi:ABC-type branched-subunit amino acid transport system substrate-binding protein